MRASIPPPLPLGWPARPVESATVTVDWLEDGRFRQTVRHAPQPGVTPAMCLWFLERVDRPATVSGVTALAYRFWHPRDHIAFTRHGPFGPGCRWHITEAFGAERRYLLDRTFRVTRLEESGFTMQLRLPGGRPVAVVDERWQPSPDGLVWTVEMTVGATTPALRSLTGTVLRRRMAFLHRWRQHNVEEAGYLPCFLPDLYHQEARS